MGQVKVLMFGWEFPPHSIGGLGNVTYNLTNALAEYGTKISLILPVKGESNNIKILPTNSITIKGIDTLLSPYMNEKTYQYRYVMEGEEAKVYAGDLIQEIKRFTEKGVILAKQEDFDIIHCHDWMTFPAGIKTKEFSGKPLILHVHATELDRSCGGCNPYVYDIEKDAFNKADKVIAVSEYTKDLIATGYGINRDKIEVVHNAITFEGIKKNKPCNQKKIVLYFGRLSMHKGPDYFIRAAKKVLEHEDDILFVVAGSGEMLAEMIDLACDLGISDKIMFTGRLKDEEVKKMYELADLYVLPSVSEPFGITVLEAASNGVPVIISKNAGVKEVLTNCFQADFWDVEDIANKIISVLRYTPVKEEITSNAYMELEGISW
ncbi:MAG: glycosyltransferase family 4 protein, partial [Candidatus Aenigmarchaeota archaeon]|nr:glycosyltransferase family 4 protein [Candidatus Aenigmarchaeota archaeon]